MFVQTLIKHGASINARGVNDYTPLHQAAAREDIDVLQLLIENGADINERTNIDNYATALEEARILNCRLSVDFLEKITR